MLLPVMVRGTIRRFGPGNRAAGLVSQHQDGSYLVEAMQYFHVDAIRGSTSRGGARALRQLLDASGRTHIFITPDGPRGPRRQLKDGIVFLASHTGQTIIPTACACGNAWVIRGSWTDLVIPKPFATVHMLLGTPFVVPADLSRDELECYRDRLQAEMEQLEVRVRGVVPPAAQSRAA